MKSLHSILLTIFLLTVGLAIFLFMKILWEKETLPKMEPVNYSPLYQSEPINENFDAKG